MRNLKLAIDTLRTGFTGDPDGLRAFAVDLLREATQSSIGLWYRFGLVDGEPLPTSWRMHGAEDLLVRRQLEERIPWPHADPRAPDPTWNRRFLAMTSILDVESQLWPTRLYRRCFEPAGIHDQLRLVVYHQGRFVGWIGVLRGASEPAVSRADVRRVAPLADALSDALIAAERMDRARSPQEASDLVLGPDGAVELASGAGLRVLEAGGVPSELAALVRRIDSGDTCGTIASGHRVRWTRLHGPSGARYLLQLEPIEPLALHPTYVLSKTQREIAALAVAGATGREIAQMKDLAPATVSSHMREVYARLGVSCRAELAGAFSSLSS